MSLSKGVYDPAVKHWLRPSKNQYHPEEWSWDGVVRVLYCCQDRDLSQHQNWCLPKRKVYRGNSPSVKIHTYNHSKLYKQPEYKKHNMQSPINHPMHLVTSRYQLLYTQRRVSLNPYSNSPSSVMIMLSPRQIVEKMVSPINSKSFFENSGHGTACLSLRTVRATTKFDSVGGMRKLTSMWDSRWPRMRRGVMRLGNNV